MTGTKRLFATPAGIALVSLATITDGLARNFVIQLRAGRFHGFVVRRGNSVTGYVDHCPHMGVPLAKALDDYLTPGGDLIACSWHGALFEIGSGRCIAGPCIGSRLWPWPVIVVDGAIITAESDEPLARPDLSSDADTDASGAQTGVAALR